MHPNIKAVLVDELPDTCTGCPYTYVVNVGNYDKDLCFGCMFMPPEYEKESVNDNGVEPYCPLRLVTDYKCVEGDPYQWRPIDEIKIKDNTIRKLKARLNMLEDRLDVSRSQLKQMRQEKNAAVGYLKRALVCEACNNFAPNRLTESCSHCSKIKVDGSENKFDWKWPCARRREKANGKC